MAVFVLSGQGARVNNPNQFEYLTRTGHFFAEAFGLTFGGIGCPERESPCSWVKYRPTKEEAGLQCTCQHKFVYRYTLDFICPLDMLCAEHMSCDMRLCIHKCIQVAAAGGNWWQAEASTTTTAPLLPELMESMPVLWNKMENAIKDYGKILIVAYSNGCVAATEFALWYPKNVQGLLLLSGAPSTAQQTQVEAGRGPLPPTIMSIGDQELSINH